VIETHLMILRLNLDPTLKSYRRRTSNNNVYIVDTRFSNPSKAGAKSGAQSNSLMVCPDYRTVPKSLSECQ